MEPSPIIIIPSPNDLALEIKRGEELAPEESIKQILTEAAKLGTIRRIKIDDSRSIVTATTISASPHTPYAIPYSDFDRIWRSQSCYRPQQESLITHNRNAFVTLHLINWAVIEKVDSGGTPHYQELDFFDLTDINKRYDKDREPALVDLQPKERRTVNEKFFNDLKQRIENNSQVLRTMYKNFVYPQIKEVIDSSSLNQRLKDNLNTTMADPGLVDNTLAVGCYSKRGEDGLGRGPQSNPNFHSHNVIYASIEKIWEAVNDSCPNLPLAEKASIFTKVLAIINKANSIQGSFKMEEIDPEIFFKQVDPYSSIFFAATKNWLEEEIRKSFEQMGINLNEQIKPFVHRTKKGRIGDIRYAEGFKITLPKEQFVEFNQGLVKFMETMYQLWKEFIETLESYWQTGNPSQFNNLIDHHHLPHQLINLLKNIYPTDKQVKKLGFDRSRHLPKPPSGKSRLSRFAKRELKETGRGYNLPGLPSVGITYEFVSNQQVLIIRISPLLSKKGVGEQVGGTPMKRNEAK